MVFHLKLIKGNSLMRILNIAAFAVSGYSCTEGRNCKPFNPLLGETYEAAYPDNGLRFISEKYLDHNQFTGRIPDAFYKHTFLKEMYIEGNAFRPGVNPIGIHNVQHYVNAQTDSYQEEVAVA
ncbi:unnamed protein product [Camellia sinensis]